MAVSRPGCRLARRLQAALPEADVFLPERFVAVAENGVPWSPPVSDLMSRLFAEYGRLVVFGSVGMTVRLIAPLAKHKRTDPAVVVVDDAGRFAVSVLSGHGGANGLTARVAEALGAQAVITTASEALGVIAVDLLGQRFDWRLEGAVNVTRVSAALVNGDPVGLLQDCGERDWWPPEKALPDNLARVSSLEELASCQAALVITDRIITAQDGAPPMVIYRPRSLVVGVGCNRGASAEEIVSTIDLALTGQGLSRASIRKLATIDIKATEAGLTQAASSLGAPVEYFSAKQLDRVAVPHPSARVATWVSTGSVCEAAALLSSQGGELVAPKFKSGNVAVAVARVDFSGSR